MGQNGDWTSCGAPQSLEEAVEGQNDRAIVIELCLINEPLFN